MLETHSTLVKFGGGVWCRSRRRYMRKVVESAVGLSDDVLVHLGIPDTGQLVATVYLCSRDYPAVAEAHDENRFDLNFTYPLIRRGKPSRFYPKIVSTAMHETLHCRRTGLLGKENEKITELIATEGIAHVGAELGMAELGLANFQPSLPMPQYAEEDQVTFEVLRDKLDSDISKAGTDYDLGTPRSDALYDRWMESSRGSGFSQGVILGSMAVSRLLSNGLVLPEIVQIPAQEIIFK